MANSVIFKSSIGKKMFMGLTGLFLITFLIVHATINGMIWFNDGGVTFNKWAHFMGTNLIIRTMEIVLFLGFIIHIADGLMLWVQNRKARPVKYVRSTPPQNTTWYSRSMAILGILILLYLIIHLAHFWVKTRHIVGNIDSYGFDSAGRENLFAVMTDVFSSPIVVVIYVAGCFALFWHLLHGFKSAFQTLGLNHLKYNKAIEVAGVAFAIIVPLVFAMMPVTMYLGWVK